MKKINLEERYQNYLRQINLREISMHPMQSKQLRQTFMAATGIVLVALRDEIGLLNEEEAVLTLEDMHSQVESFFKKLL